MKVIVTGCGSFLGRHTVRALKEAGYDVCAMKHSFEEEEKIPEKADIWIHYAWAGKGSEGRTDERIQEENIQMCMRALIKASELGVSKFLFAGSQAEYSGNSAYGRAKKAFGQAAESYLKTAGSGMKFLHMRIFSVYGPGDHEGSLISTMINKALSGEDMDLGPCTQLWNYTYVDDLIRAVLLLIRAGDIQGVIDTSGDDTRPLKAYAEEAWNVLSAKGKLNFGARGNNAEGAADLVPDTGRIKACGFETEVSFAEGIRIMTGEIQ